MNVAFIPVRGGSKSIPEKNRKEFCGRPLVYWAARAASECEGIDAVYVATDSARIREEVERFGLKKVRVIGRSAETATDTAATESAMLEFAGACEFDTILLIQATSPLLRAEDLQEGLRVYGLPDTDSVLSVVRQKRVWWKEDENGYLLPQNYDYRKRPRRQEFEGFLAENGAFYITGRDSLLRSGCRISGRIRACEMPADSYLELDEPSDWAVMEMLLRRRLSRGNGESEPSGRSDPGPIRLAASDCDGVLTDGGMYYSGSGDEMKKFNALDGMGFELLRQCGIRTAIITGEDHPLLIRRAKKLGVDDLILGERDKLGALKRLCAKYGISLKETAYIGDDIFDIPALEACGFACAPRSAPDEVKERADYVTERTGGEGCFREMADRIRKRLL